MKRHDKIILLTAIAALTADVVLPRGYVSVSLTQMIAQSQPAQPAEPEHDYQPTRGEGPTTIAVGFAASGTATNTTSQMVAYRSI